MEEWDFHFLGNTAWEIDEMGLAAQWLEKAHSIVSPHYEGYIQLLARLADCHFLVELYFKICFTNRLHEF